MSRYGFPELEIPSMAPIESHSAVVTRPAEPQKTLEDYPRVLEAIVSMWGFKELNVYFNKLVLDDRGGREGFPPEVWDDITMLMRMHEDVMPGTLIRTGY